MLLERKPLPVLGSHPDDQLLDYELDGVDGEAPARKWRCRNLGTCSRDMGSLPLYMPDDNGKRRPLIGWRCAVDCTAFEPRDKDEERSDRDGLGRLAAAILETHPVSVRSRTLQDKARAKLRQDKLSDALELEDFEDEAKPKKTKAKPGRVEHVLDGIVDEASRRKAIVDLRFNRTSYGRKSEIGDLDPKKVDKVRALIVDYSEKSLSPASDVPFLKTLETMSPEERAEMERLYAPMSNKAKQRVDKYDKSNGAVDRLMKGKG